MHLKVNLTSEDSKIGWTSLFSSMWIVTQMVVVIWIEWLLNVFLMLNRNMILHPSLNFMLLHVLISLLTRLRLKIIKTWLLHLGRFPRDYRAVVHEENWANCPFKRKLYYYSDLLLWNIWYFIRKTEAFTMIRLRCDVLAMVRTRVAYKFQLN